MKGNKAHSYQDMLDSDIALPFPLVCHIPSVSSGRRPFMSPPGLQNCQSGPQHQSWKALAIREAHQLPGLITHIFFTLPPLWSCRGLVFGGEGSSGKMKAAPCNSALFADCPRTVAAGLCWVYYPRLPRCFLPTSQSPGSSNLTGSASLCCCLLL